MSQQTRMETVVPYYRRWIRRFPDAASLAAAEQEEVLALWEGLGYYSRARNLHRAARELQARYGGRVPSDPAELQSLPGVGPYTAGAVASMAFGVPAPAVDGNVRRVLARLLDDPAPTPARLREWAAALVDPGRPGDFNQALMELGSLVCTPRSPRCRRCPLADFCGARAAGTQEQRPAPRQPREVPRVVEAVAVLHRDAAGGGSRLLLRRRPSEGLLGGMWELPGVQVAESEEAGRAAAGLARELCGSQRESAPGGNEFPEGRALAAVDHAFSHLKVTYRPFLFYRVPATADEPATRDEPATSADGTPQRWVDASELRSLPIPVAQRRILRLVEASLAGA